MALDKYRKPPQAPPIFNATSESLIADAKKLNDTSQKMMDQIVELVKPETATFANTVLPIALDENESLLSSRVIIFYKSVSTDKGLRDASTEAEKLMDEFSIEANTREDIYQLVDAVYRKGEELDPESQRLLEKIQKDFIRSGLGIPAGRKRDRFKEIKKKLNYITTVFQNALNEENGGVWVTKEELEGVPRDVVEGLEKGVGEHEDKVKLPFEHTKFFPAMKFALNSGLRKKIFIEYENKVSHINICSLIHPKKLNFKQCNDSVPLFREVIILRDEAARLLGYPDHASFRIEERIAKTPKTVLDFLRDLRTHLTPGGVKETEHLKELKRQNLITRGLGATYDDNYYLWDHQFYGRLMVENEYSIDKQNIAEYFPLESTIKGMLRIFEKLFGLVFVEIEGVERDKISETGKGADIVWHEDVKLFSVWDDEGEGSAFSGYLYMDLHPRVGKHNNGKQNVIHFFIHFSITNIQIAAKFNLQPGFLLPDGTRRYPAAALVCNVSEPMPENLSLLKHNEVETIFHELGHGIHDLVGRTTYSRFHGTSVAWDFVEAPSQMLEYWCWIPSQLKSLSNHYETGEEMPDDLIDKLVHTKHVNSALLNLRQLHMGFFDLAIHTPTSHEEAKNMKISELYNDLRIQIVGLKGPEALGMPK